LKNINTIAATAAGVSSEQEGKEVFKVVEQMPRFPGCENEPLSDQERKQCAQKKLLEFVYENIRYPETAKSKNISGMVVVKFVVDHEGKVQNPEIVRDIGGGCGKEALRVVELMQDKSIRWVSGKHQGQNVSVQFNLPVKFQFE
jgi:protein TonB